MFFLLLISTVEPAPSTQTLLQSRPDEVSLNELLSLRPIENHHFEMKAPQRCGSFELKEKSPQLIQCQITQAGAHEISLSICDDSKKYCKPENFVVRTRGSEPMNVARTALTYVSPLKLPQGFVGLSFESALKRATKEKRLLLVNVTTSWCPPCNLNKENLFPTDTFQKVTQNWIKIQIDGDDPRSADFRATYKARSYPSLLVFGAQGAEVARIIGDISPEKFSQKVADLRPHSPSLQDLTEKRIEELSDQESIRLAEYLWDIRQSEQAIEIIRTRKGSNAQSLLLEMELELAKDEAQKKKLLTSAISSGNLSKEEVLSRIIELGEISSETARSFSKLAQSIILERLANTHGIDRAHLLRQVGDFHEVVLNDKSAGKKFAFEAGEIFESEWKSGGQKSRSLVMLATAAYHDAEAFPFAIRLNKLVAKREPHDPTFWYRLARSYSLAGRKEDAIQAIDRGLLAAKGGEHYWRGVDLKVSELKSLKRVQEAKEILSATLKKIQLPKDIDATAHDWYQSFKEQLHSL